MFILSRVNLTHVSQLFRHGEDREINLFVGRAARTSNSTCAGCATIRRLMKCPGRVILHRHNGASSGSTRIISLGCVRAANNSLLFPAPGTDDASLMTTGKEEDQWNVRSFVSHSFASCRVRLSWTRMHPHADAIVRDFPRVRERSDTSISNPESQLATSCEILQSSSCRKIIVESLTRKSTIVMRYAMHTKINHLLLPFCRLRLPRLGKFSERIFILPINEKRIFISYYCKGKNKISGQIFLEVI